MTIFPFCSIKFCVNALFLWYICHFRCSFCAKISIKRCNRVLNSHPTLSYHFMFLIKVSQQCIQFMFINVTISILLKKKKGEKLFIAHSISDGTCSRCIADRANAQKTTSSRWKHTHQINVSTVYMCYLGGGMR